MALETGTYISDLVSTNPVGATDPKSQGDDHIRLIKSTLLATFPNITGAVTLTHTQINDAARLGAANAFTGANTFSAGQTFTGFGSGSAALDIANALPRISFEETDGAANNQVWYMEASGEAWNIKLANDARSATATALSITRTANTVDQITLSAGELQFDGTTLDINAAADFNSTLTAAGRIRSTDVSNGIDVYSAVPRIGLFETGVTTDQGGWQILANSSVFGIYSATDGNYPTITGGVEAIGISRSGVTITEIELNATLIDINGSAVFSAGITVEGGESVFNDAIKIQGQYTTSITGPHSFLDVVSATTGRLGFATTGGNRAPGSMYASGFTFDMDGGNVDFGSHVLITPNASASEVGFKGTPQNAQNASYTLLLTDAGKLISCSAGSGGTWTIPANASVAFPNGTVVTFSNQDNNARTIAITSDTLYWAGSGSTGSRTLAQYGVATAIKVGATSWVISGSGLS